jgi:hypothetical protein
MIDFDERNQNEREVRWLQKGMVFDRYCLVTDHTSGEILIESGYGISFWVERMCDPEIYPNLCFIDIEDDEDIAKTCVAYRREELTLQCRTLIEYTKRYGRNH